jgi:benzoylformate decarboxylase
MSTVREVTFDLLRELGMTTVFGNPGSTELPFLRDFPDDFRYILGLQEATVLGMADGYAQGTGEATLVNLHTGPGIARAGAFYGAATLAEKMRAEGWCALNSPPAG